ncbi:thioesterase II family protein [Streptomyces palmae]|uniref:Thioesterase n=1 Tax=Streptomyces palmae TaxID=1701085 RepID=A0A4Z0HE47_9ACTN|nr:alpha/beta fold hydrolase [Streptomyces palmae]TGB12363.1 thioesterase [Streptomyces palmae]
MSGTQRDNDEWVRRFHPADSAGVRVVCLPHAGGSAPFFFPVSAALAGNQDLDVLSVQYPGRQDRRDQPPIDHLPTLADQVFEALRGWADRPLVLMGHSMGAVIGYEVARRFEQAGDGAPLGLIASGRRAPSVYREEAAHLLDDQRFIGEIRALSGTASSLLEDEELVRMVLPALRADYKAIETHEPATEPPLRCPIGVLTGESDPRVSVAEARAWREHTTGGFHFRSYSGGHFYLNDHQEAVAGAIADYAAEFVKEAANR